MATFISMLRRKAAAIAYESCSPYARRWDGAAPRLVVSTETALNGYIVGGN
jgi:hypothetical protein